METPRVRQETDWDENNREWARKGIEEKLATLTEERTDSFRDVDTALADSAIKEALQPFYAWLMNSGIRKTVEDFIAKLQNNR